MGAVDGGWSTMRSNQKERTSLQFEEARLGEEHGSTHQSSQESDSQVEARTSHIAVDVAALDSIKRQMTEMHNVLQLLGQRQKNEEGSVHALDTVDSIKSNIEDIYGVIDEFRIEVKDLIPKLGDKDELISKLTEDLREAQRDQVALVLNPGISSLIRLRSHLEEALKRDSTPTREPNAISTEADLGMSLELIEEVFSSFGFEKVCAEPGQRFDKKMHQAAGTVETDNENLHETIMKVVTPGYRYSGAKKTAFPARVIVYKFSM